MSTNTVEAMGTGTLYRVRQPKPGLDLIHMSELVDALFCDVPCGATPETPHVPEGEWYCENSGCDVREVHIRAKHYDGVPKRRPAYKCPGCGKVLKFHHYLKTLTLLPAESGLVTVECGHCGTPNGFSGVLSEPLEPVPAQ